MRSHRRRTGTRPSRSSSNHIRSSLTTGSSSRKTAIYSNINSRHDSAHRPVITSPRYSVVEEEDEEEWEEGDGHDYFSPFSDTEHGSPMRSSNIDTDHGPPMTPHNIDIVPRIDGTESMTYKPVLDRLAESRRRQETRVASPRNHTTDRSHRHRRTLVEGRSQYFTNYTGIPASDLGDDKFFTKLPETDTYGQYSSFRGKYKYPQDNINYQQQQQQQQPRGGYPSRRVHSQPELRDRDSNMTLTSSLVH